MSSPNPTPSRRIRFQSPLPIKPQPRVSSAIKSIRHSVNDPGTKAEPEPKTQGQRTKHQSRRNPPFNNTEVSQVAANSPAEQPLDAESRIPSKLEETAQEDKARPELTKTRKIRDAEEEKRWSAKSVESLESRSHNCRGKSETESQLEWRKTVNECGDVSSFAEKSVEQREEEEDSDVFLQLVLNHSKNSQCKRIRNQTAKVQAQGHRCTHPRCAGGKSCARYLRGSVGCCIPKTPALIEAAEERIANLEQSPIVLQLEQDMRIRKSASFQLGVMEIAELESRIETATASSIVRQMESEKAFVKMYEMRMEERCVRGKWWERWAVLEDLRSKGFGRSGML